jgi:hypothetical protein
MIIWPTGAAHHLSNAVTILTAKRQNWRLT